MKKWRIAFWKKPTTYNPRRTAIVEAETPNDALTLLRAQLNDPDGEWSEHWYHPEIELIQEGPLPPGKVINIE